MSYYDTSLFLITIDKKSAVITELQLTDYLSKIKIENNQMYIYSDESGVFKTDKKPHSISCVTALVVPNIIKPRLFDACNQWKLLPSLKNKKNEFGEIKGSKLNEEEIASLLSLLAKFDVLVETSCIDVGMTTDPEVDQYKIKLANNFANSQTGQRLNIQFNKDILMSLSNPLFLQSLTLYETINKVLETAITYYAQRLPLELGSFEWTLDAKNKCITEYEQILKYVINPFLQQINLNNITSILDEADYSAFNKFLIPREHLLEPLKSSVSNSPALIYSLNDIMQNISFEQSDKNVGLQIVDILANCIQRAMNNKLQFNGWKYLSSLIVLRKDQAILVIHFYPERILTVPPYSKFVNYFQTCGKKMLVPDKAKQKIKQTNKGYIQWSFLDKESNNRRKRTTLEYY